MLFKIYKRGQGKYTRLYSVVGFSLVAGIGCYRLYQELHGRGAGLWIETLVPVCLLAVISGLILWLVNKPSLADFMISAEGEMKKVSWSSRQEVTLSTSVVILVVAFLSVLLGVTDLVLRTFFTLLLK